MSAASVPELEARLAATSLDKAEVVPRIQALLALAAELRLGEPDRAHDLARVAHALSLEAGYRMGQARAARTLAMTIQTGGQMARLVQLSEEAVRVFDEVGDAPGRAASRDFLASIYEHLGEPTIALELSLDALDIARALGDPTRIGYALSNVGGILASSGELEAGLERLDEGLAIFEKLGDLSGVILLASRLCRAFHQAGQTEAALTQARRCRDLAAATQGEWGHNEWGLAVVGTVIGEIAEQRGDLVEAEQQYRRALAEVRTEAVRNLVGAGIQVALARLLMRRRAWSEAEAQLADAVCRVQGDTISTVAEADAHEALAEVCEAQDRLPEALGHLRRAHALRAQIGQRDARNRLAQVEARAAMDAARKDAEIHKLRFVELHAMQSELLEAEKMALLGTIAAGTAHELNSPLGVLRSNQQLNEAALTRIVASVPEDPSRTKLIRVLKDSRRTSEQALDRIIAVAEGFRRFTQLDGAEVRRFDVCEALDSALALLTPSFPQTIKVTRDFGDVPLIRGWPKQLNQAFMTVIRNAAEAIEGEGTVTVQTRSCQGQVLVRVRDTGPGLSDALAAHLFDMAWSDATGRTKMRMGLCAALVTTRRHGGSMEVETVLGEGTTIVFRLPTGAEPDRSVRRD